MDFDTWNPVYEAIIADFGFERAADEHARDVLGAYVGPFDYDRLAFVDGATVAVAGAGPSLEDDLDSVRSADAVVAASSAADVLLDAGVAVDLLVTDLDGNPGTARALTERGVPVVAHAHGDNVPAVREHVPTFDREHVLATTQAEPRGPVENFGGFTDGDRAAFLADHFGAAELVFPGWDVDDSSVGPVKRRKLAWAERLLYWLERRRGDRFAVLDGRRDVIDASALPE
ncbi:6-hydroxymethylpterin diphosphokinase MptE-like protein [Halomicrococcus sp. NG-SE-24]|uniref:6-hydroxymethylpterin diphosphokinase MptE-like protein n=1 Tax=Halomicrococcus sp. NG-SE-24 TaxID=3436928 RepID=UPI003D99245F